MEAVADGPWKPSGVRTRDHVVQFYRDNEELADRAGDYLAAAVRRGGVAIAIATHGHRLALERRMAAAGVDVPGAEARGDYVPVDAEATLLRILTRRSTPDRARFDLVIGGLLYRAASTDRPVCAYGELVAMLWRAGQTASAVELEELWHGLARRYAFGLWCSYPAEQMAADHLVDPATSVCCMHDVVIGDIHTRRRNIAEI